MKKKGILHPELAYMVANVGHTDYIVVADKGYPVPKQVERINVGLTDNIPTVLDVLQALAEEMNIDRIVITREMEDVSPERAKTLRNRFPHIHFDVVSHQEFKKLTQSAYGVVKTADNCPYANVIVVSG